MQLVHSLVCPSDGLIILNKTGVRNEDKRRHIPDSFAREAHHALRFARGHFPLDSNVRSEEWRRGVIGIIRGATWDG